MCRHQQQFAATLCSRVRPAPSADAFARPSQLFRVLVVWVAYVQLRLCAHGGPEQIEALDEAPALRGSMAS